MGTRASAALGLALGAVTAAFYFMGSGRSLDYDSSLTVGAFVKTGWILDPLRRQIQLNNHPLFSVLEHIVWSAGLHTETYLRVLPIAAAALTVALLTAWCAHFWGFVPGVSAGAVLATNPMFADLSRGVRGYSLLAFCALTSTLLMWRLLSPVPTHRAVAVLYVLFLAAGISTHLYGCTVVVVHLAVVVARRRLDSTWVARWLGGGFLGGLIYLKTSNIVLHTQNTRVFHREFGREVALSILGQARVAAAALAIVVVVALWLARRRTEFVSGVAVIVAFGLFVWIVLQPQFLVVRYWVWIIPGVGLAAAFLVSRHPAAIALVVVAVAAMALHERPTWTTVQNPTSETAALVDAARAQGMHVCGFRHTGVAVLAYTAQPKKATTFEELAQCDLVVGFYVPGMIDRLERGVFAYSWKIPGQFPAFVYSRTPRATLAAATPRRREDLDTHPRTYPK
ncbi:MAG: hypothetical protein QOH10_1819 [Actinomycetota bacterium]|nr:hypothetical protein [Actinomycetota bacterium]